jgi:hypothetical protein
MIYYLIRHKSSGKYMPQAKKNRGYTHWNPSNQNNPVEFNDGLVNALSVPRLLPSKKMALACIVQWAFLPNATTDYDGDIKLGKDDGRKKEDLEVVEVCLKIKGPNDAFWSNLVMG